MGIDTSMIVGGQNLFIYVERDAFLYLQVNDLCNQQLTKFQSKLVAELN